MRRCESDMRPRKAVRTSSTWSMAISLALRPQQQARRKMTRFSRVFFERLALRCSSANTIAISRRVRILIGSANRAL